jgi:hypothetical protein
MPEVQYKDINSGGRISELDARSAAASQPPLRTTEVATEPKLFCTRLARHHPLRL